MTADDGGRAVEDVRVHVLVDAVDQALGQEGVGRAGVEGDGEGELVQVEARAELRHVAEVEEHAVEPDARVLDRAVGADGDHGPGDQGAGVLGRVDAAKDDVALRRGDVVEPDAVGERSGQAVLHQELRHGGVGLVLLRGGEAEAQDALGLGRVLA